uniref:uncharacterized protein n=1 Tax=Pristiophorus japonicus TaxID=55135 RepID=UPI00398E885A
MIFTLLQLQEKCRVQHQPLYMTSFDLTKAFDTVNREGLWSSILRFGCPQKFITILRLLHDDMQAVVLTNGFITDPIHVRTGVKQGYVIAPTFFSIFLAAMLHLTLNKLPAGVELNYRTSGNLFNLRRLQARSKTIPSSVVELQYADDACICAHSEAELQVIACRQKRSGSGNTLKQPGESFSRKSFHSQVKEAQVKPAEGKCHNLEPGKFVYIKIFKRKSSLQPRFEGPYQVLLATNTAIKVKERPTWIHAPHYKRAPDQGEGKKEPEEQKKED